MIVVIALCDDPKHTEWAMLENWRAGAVYRSRTLEYFNMEFDSLPFAEPDPETGLVESFRRSSSCHSNGFPDDQSLRNSTTMPVHWITPRDEERFKLRFGPYWLPAYRYGQRVYCQARGDPPALANTPLPSGHRNGHAIYRRTRWRSSSTGTIAPWRR